MREVADELDDPLVLDAIEAACIAGACGAAARMDRKSASIWTSIADKYSLRASDALERFVAAWAEAEAARSA